MDFMLWSWFLLYWFWNAAQLRVRYPSGDAASHEPRVHHFILLRFVKMFFFFEICPFQSQRGLSRILRLLVYFSISCKSTKIKQDKQVLASLFLTHRLPPFGQCIFVAPKRPELASLGTDFTQHTAYCHVLPYIIHPGWVNQLANGRMMQNGQNGNQLTQVHVFWIWLDRAL